MKITDFDIQLNKDAILAAVNCLPDSPVYARAANEYDRVIENVENLLTPAAYIKSDGDFIYCLITAGGAVSDYSEKLFDEGEAVAGLIVNAAADEFLFKMDSAVSERIKTECAKISKGIKKRMEAPADMPLEKQRLIMEAIGESDISLTDGLMFSPVKTMGYILELTDDEAVFNAQHDCSKCSAKDCPRRRADMTNSQIITDYSYSPTASEDALICIDIGTTTVVFEFICGGTREKYSEINKQRQFGADVLSRIEAANRGRAGELRQIIQYQLLGGVRHFSKKYGAPDKIIISANTAMTYLLMGYPCAELGAYPFHASHTDTIETTFDKIVPNGSLTAPVSVIGGISAFVGGDITSGMYMCDFDLSEQTNIFIDLGTNGEMAIGNKDGITVTSAAAGPAFEGGRIRCGTGSVEGAISGVDIKTGRIETIGNKAPVGLCGTGIIELISELLENGIIDKTGLLTEKYFQNGYPVADGVVFLQSDIREIQTAKAAICAGIETLMLHHGVSAEEIGTVYLAGGFGFMLNTRKACNIGLIPQELSDKIKIIGNSALGGAAKYPQGGSERILHIQNISSEINLGGSEDFNRLYIERMNF